MDRWVEPPAKPNKMRPILRYVCRRLGFMAVGSVPIRMAVLGVVLLSNLLGFLA
jgi:hypothetical protein